MKHINTILLVLVAAIGSLVYVSPIRGNYYPLEFRNSKK